MNMVLRKAAFLLLAPTLTTGYFSDVNNAHVQLLHSDPVALETNNLELLLENKLWGDHTPSSVVAEFESWIEKFERRYETVSEKGERLLVWLENHGASSITHTLNVPSLISFSYFILLIYLIRLSLSSFN
jgi:hypothetical protein